MSLHSGSKLERRISGVFFKNLVKSKELSPKLYLVSEFYTDICVMLGVYLKKKDLGHIHIFALPFVRCVRTLRHVWSSPEWEDAEWPNHAAVAG